MSIRDEYRRRRLAAGRRTPPAAVGAYVAGGLAGGPEELEAVVAAARLEDVEAALVLEDVELAAAVEEAMAPPPLSLSQVTRLEALTAQWVREVRVGGPGPDDTLLYAAPKPPPPPGPRLPAAPPVSPADDRRTAALAAAEAVRAGRHRPPAEPYAGPPSTADRTPAMRPPPDVVSRETTSGRVSDWASRHDPASLAYAVRARLHRPVPLQDFMLERGPILDQGTTPPLTPRDASACTGMAAVAAANVLRRRAGTPLLGLEDARAAYALAQDRDHLSGRDYAGTSVLAVMKAGQELGWWDHYLWAIGGTRDVAQVLLQLQAAVVVGLPWPAGMESPDAAGIVEPTGAAGMGHALAVVGIKLAVAGRPGPWFALQQSRGTSEGDGGLVYLHHAHLARLLAGRGEAAVPILEGMA